MNFIFYSFLALAPSVSLMPTEPCQRNLEIDHVKILKMKIEHCQDRMDQLEFEFSEDRNGLLSYYHGKKSAYEDCIEILQVGESVK
jgi:hypothetical protein